MLFMLSGSTRAAVIAWSMNASVNWPKMSIAMGKPAPCRMAKIVPKVSKMTSLTEANRNCGGRRKEEKNITRGETININ